MAADSNTETTTPASDGTSADHGSEFSRGTGAEDSAIWDKHFGKGSKEPTRESRKTSDSKTSTDSKKTTRDDEPSGKRGGSERSATSADTDKAKQTQKKPEPSSKKESESTGKAASEATGQKTADEKDSDKEAPADPEAPLKKARDLYKQAQKTEDRREARKLYKRAMVEAFGEVPEEFDDKRYAAVRTERAAAKAALDEQAKKNETRIKDAAEKLKPAIYVMRQLETAGVDGKLTVPLVERAVSVMRALVRLDDGDYTGLAEVVSKATGVDPDEAMKRFVANTKVSPEGRRARAAAQQAEERAARAEARIQDMERKLQERDTQQTEAQKKQERERQQQESRERYLDDIETELDGHPVLKLPRGRERVLAYLIKTRHPTLNTARYSFQQVADKIVAGERRRLEGSRHLLGEGEAEERTETRQRQSNGSVGRTETRDSGVRNESPEAAFDRIFERNRAAGGRR